VDRQDISYDPAAMPVQIIASTRGKTTSTRRPQAFGAELRMR
jgi:hypothetical protein